MKTLKKSSTLCEEFLQFKLLKGLKLSSIGSYDFKLKNYILTKLPAYTFQISEKKIYIAVEELKQSLSNKTLIDTIILFNDLLTFAYDKHCILKHISIPIPQKIKRKIDIFSETEQVKLKKYLFSNTNHFNFGILLVLFSGLRIGELAALQLNDIDINTKAIHITKTLQRVKNTDEDSTKATKIAITLPKTQSSIRSIPLKSILFDILRSLDFESENAYILTGTAKFLEPRAIERKFKKMLQELDLKPKKFHTLRHTFATNCTVKGFDIKALSVVLGHSSVQITMDYYVHPDFEFIKQNMSKV